MDKDKLTALKEQIAKEFTDLKKQSDEIGVELLKKQGEYRLVEKLLAELEVKK